MIFLYIIFLFCWLVLGAARKEFTHHGISDMELVRIDYKNNTSNALNSKLPYASFLSSDDLFNEMNNIWVRKVSDYDREDLGKKSITKVNFLGLTTLPTTKMSEFENSTANRPTSNKQLHDNHWARIRGIMGNMKSLLLRLYGEETPSSSDISMFSLLDKLLQIGDRINMISTIQNNFDHELLDFLKEKWSVIEVNIFNDYPFLSSIFAIDVKSLFMAVAKGLTKQFGNVFHKQANAHLNEQDFVLETMRSSGFRDSEIYDVFMLLSLPTKDLIATSSTLESEARSFGITNLFSKRSHGVGHGGGYGGGYGYHMMTKDPFLILAGLALATFAAYIIYQLLTTTAAVKRSVPNDILSLDLSDMPETMTNLHRWLDTAEMLYGNFQNSNVNNKDSFSDTINQLWRSFAVDKASGSCIRRYLCQLIQNNKFHAISSGMDLEQLTLLGLAELLGEKGAGKTVDNYITKAINEEENNCLTETVSCNEQKLN